MTGFYEAFDTPRGRDDEEILFSRDVNGQLVRLDAATEADFQTKVTLRIDGEEVKDVPLARPRLDANGSPVPRPDGKGDEPWYTTVYDAAMQHWVREPGDEARIPIPTLCHQPHMTPVAVCRVCVVQIYQPDKDGRRKPQRKLLPACRMRVAQDMEVFTMNAPGPDGERVRRAVKVLTELLSSDHLADVVPPEPPGEGPEQFNELRLLGARLNDSGCPVGLRRYAPGEMLGSGEMPGTEGGPPSGLRLPRLSHRPVDESSPVFRVDHGACILCDRCSRACDEVKENHVIGRTGKGRGAGIAFDLDVPMGESGCVQCGECMVSCPTSAITCKPIVPPCPEQGGPAAVKAPAGPAAADEAAPAMEGLEVTVSELRSDPLFASVPAKFLLWQKGLVRRWRVRPPHYLCRQGDPGNTAFLIRSGRFQVTAWDPGDEPRQTLVDRLLRRPGVAPPKRVELGVRDREGEIVGEMACISGTARTADVSVLEAGEVWEVRRNVLDRIMRTPWGRRRFEEIYQKRALTFAPLHTELFSDLGREELKRCGEALANSLKFTTLRPRTVLFRQGQFADALYLIRLGHMEVRIGRPGVPPTVLHRGPGSVIGEIGLLGLIPEDAARFEQRLAAPRGEAADRALDAIVDEHDAALDEALRQGGGGGLPAGQRTATCTALDPVELAYVPRAAFLELIRGFPKVRRRLIRIAVERLLGEGEPESEPHQALTAQYRGQELYHARSLLVLDLEKCTRCDECTRACVEQHGTASHGYEVTRLLRDGLRFGPDDRYLIATSCRSCEYAYCMVGCPVDSIHRGKHQQIVIEDHCIGCRLCERNCPYGNIQMLPDERRLVTVPDPGRPGGTKQVARLKASTCDQCDAADGLGKPVPRCVHACPHDAAHRMKGEDLLKEAREALGRMA